MKRSGVLYVYLGIISVLTILGYSFDGHLGIWRQSIVGCILLAIGFVFCFKDMKQKRKNELKRENRKALSTISVSCMIAGGILLSIAVRLLITNIVAVSQLMHTDVSLYSRVIGTVLLPSVCVTVLAFVIFPYFTATKPIWLKLTTCAISFAPFCTSVAYLPAALLLGLICGVCNEYLMKIRWEEIFVSFTVLLFYDTLSISLGSIDFNLTMYQVLSFLFISLSMCCLLGYLAFRALREKRVRIAEFLTVLLIAVILLCIALAL